MQNGKGGPWWITVLTAAEAWSRPPWEVAGDEDRLTWLLRWRAYMVQVLKKYSKDGDGFDA